MTGKILEFKKRDGASPHHRSTDKPVERAAVSRIKTNYELFQDTHEFVIEEWQRHAVKNRLNEFIFSKLPHYARGQKDADYVNDLNVISGVELKLELKVAVFYPGCTFNNPYGWLAAFHRGKEVFTTPPDMASEANARALNILLYLAFTAELKKIGRD